jgi:hypothetical protein
MNTLLAAPAGRNRPIDLLFTSQSKTKPGMEADAIASSEDDSESQSDEDSGRGKGSGGSAGGFTPQAIAKFSLDINDTQKKSDHKPVLNNMTLFKVNLLERLKLSAEALWRNPVRAKISNWGRREVMHIFNGGFHQAMSGEWDRYETFGKCYTAPDPFKNDDPPYKAAFMI